MEDLKLENTIQRIFLGYSGKGLIPVERHLIGGIKSTKNMMKYLLTCYR